MNTALYRKFTLTLIPLTLSFNAAALECYIGETTDESQAIGKLVLLSGTQNGSKVWESKEYSRTITCKTKIKENVYFYPFPKIKSQTMPKGVQMGLIYDGKDLGTFDEASGNGNINTKIDTGWPINKTTATRTFRIKAYLKKTGEIDTSKVSGAIHLFQLDGKGGLNLSPDAKNYKFSLSQWNQTGTVSCSRSYSNTSFRMPVTTTQALSASSTLTVKPVVRIVCASESAGVINLLSSITGNFSLSGTTMANRKDLYGSDKEHFGYAVAYNGAALIPGKSVPLTIPLTSGMANHTVQLDLKPRLEELKLNSPAWIFNDAEKEVKTKLTPVFTPLSVSTR